MKNRKKDTRWLVSVALLAAIIIVMANTPLGFIPLPITKATTTHIPVILGAILLGPLAGAILGGVFGICSIVVNTFTPGLTAFAFSPFMSTTGLSGAVKALWVALGCRILLGVVAGWLWIALKKVRVSDWLALPVTGFVCTILHTLMVMGSIFFLFTQQSAQARNVAMEAVSGLILATVTGNGIPAALLAMVLVTAIGKALLRVNRMRTLPA